MSVPPRLKEIYPRTDPLTYFITWCVQDRKPVLANPSTFMGLRRALVLADQWHVWAATLMPDHIHLLASPFIPEELPNRLSGFVKRKVNGGNQSIIAWQRGSFDRLLRSGESSQQKWKYIRENPVRAGLVKRWQDWPYHIGFQT
jgi:REP element-mobilizing transposase RayT